MSELCWICGAPATTREHILKASDVAQLYPDLSEDNPVYLINDGARPRRIYSKKNGRLKFRPSLCLPCNSARTQPHDVARARFAQVLVPATRITNYGAVNIALIYPDSPRKNLLRFHLWCAKFLGCTSVEEEVPIDLLPLARGIQDESAVPDLWITTASYGKGSDRIGVVRSPVNVLFQNEEAIFLECLYLIDALVIHLRYLPTGRREIPMPRNAWHPGQKIERIRFGRVERLAHRCKVVR